LNPATPCLIFNPSARGEKARRLQTHAAIPRGQCVFLATNAPGHARELAGQAVRNGYRTLVAAGGDGTVNEVINGIGDVPGGFASVRLGLLPSGTVNVFARELGLPIHARRAWEILSRGRERSIDLGRAEFTLEGGRQIRYFVQLAGAGVDSRAIELTQWGLKKKFGPIAYLIAGLKAVREPRPPITVQSTDSLTGEWVGLGNGRYYGGPFAVFPKARLDDGLLDICVVPEINAWRFLAALCGFATGRLHQFSGAQLRSHSLITLTSPSRVLLQLDGENVGELPAHISVVPKALRVLVP
jgi:YegS/Rv2252/BmrU family lipid kinase